MDNKKEEQETTLTHGTQLTINPNFIKEKQTPQSLQPAENQSKQEASSFSFQEDTEEEEWLSSNLLHLEIF